MEKNATNDELFNPNVVVECYKLKSIGVYSSVLFIIGLISNPTLIGIILRNRDLWNEINILLAVLALLNLIGVLIELPLVTISAFMCRFTFGKFGCYWEAFVMFFIGSSTIYILSLISFIR